MNAELRLQVSSEFLDALKAHHARRLDKPSLANMARDYILRTMRELERAERAEAREERRERARLAKLERKAAQARIEAATAERARAREERRAARAAVPTWNEPPGQQGGPEPT